MSDIDLDFPPFYERRVPGGTFRCNADSGASLSLVCESLVVSGVAYNVTAHIVRRNGAWVWQHDRPFSDLNISRRDTDYTSRRPADPSIAARRRIEALCMDLANELGRTPLLRAGERYLNARDIRACRRAIADAEDALTTNRARLVELEAEAARLAG